MIAPGTLLRRGTARHVVVTIGLGAAGVAAMAWRFGWSPPLPAYLVLAVVGAIVAVADATEYRIPAVVVLPAYPLAAASLAMASAWEASWGSFERAVGAAAAVGLGYLVYALIVPGLGFGDVRLGGLLGAYLGFLGWPDVAGGVLLGWLLGSCFVLVRHRTASRHVRLPFGPFLLAGAFVVILASK